MKILYAIFATTLTAISLNGIAYAASANADANQWLAIPAIYEKVIAAGYIDIKGIELKHHGYKVKAYDSNGEQVRLLVDPVSGRLLDIHDRQKLQLRQELRPGLIRISMINTAFAESTRAIALG